MKERPILFSGEMVRAILDGRKTMTRRVVNPQPEGGNGTERWSFACCSTHRPTIGTFGCSIIDPSGSSYTDRGVEKELLRLRCPYGLYGDRLWVRETWRPAYDAELFCCVEYRADGARMKPQISDENTGHRFADDCPDEPDLHAKWRPSIFMPRWASRILLEITEVRVQRLQEITEEDAQREGCPMSSPLTMPQFWFEDLWDKLNEKRGYGWETNPWVWVIGFMERKESV